MVLAVFFAGTFGYSYIEGWSLFDAAYMTVITLTTTGYQEVHQLSDSGRLFTMILLIVGAAILTYGLREFLRIQLIDPDRRRRRKMYKKIQELQNHVVLCGFGRMGKIISTELEMNEIPFVVIEKSEDRIAELKESNLLWIEGDASDDNDLIEANIDSAKTLLIALDNDADALYCLVGAKNINPNLKIICRANSEAASNRLYRLGASKVVMPITTSAIQAARSAIFHDGEALIDIPVGIQGSADINMLEIPVSSALDTKVAKEIVQKLGLVLVGYKRNDEFMYAYSGLERMNDGDKLLVISNSSDAVGIKSRFEEMAT